MSGVFDYGQYINLLETVQDCRNQFPRDQQIINYDFDGLGAEGWTADTSWLTLIVDTVSFSSTNEPDFSGSTVIGYFTGGTGTQFSSTGITVPANMYTGPILPAFSRNIPISIFTVNWRRSGESFSRQFAFIQNWEPGVEIGDPKLDPNFIPIEDSLILSVSYTVSTTTANVTDTITVEAIATGTGSSEIVNPISLRLREPVYSGITSATVATSVFASGTATLSFSVPSEWVEMAPTQTSNYTITTSSQTTTTYSIEAVISRSHQVELAWTYEATGNYRGGVSSATTITVSTTRSVTYTAGILPISLTADRAQQRLGTTSTFYITPESTETAAIVGPVTLSADFTPYGLTTATTVILGTSTFGSSNSPAVISALLNSGTYVLQAYYAGNIGSDIFRPMYRAGYSNTLTHLVAIGNEFSLAELLIEERPTEDILHAHFIDNGLTANQLGGYVSFYNQGTFLGTATTLRHTYSITDPTSGDIESFQLLSQDYLLNGSPNRLYVYENWTGGELPPQFNSWANSQLGDVVGENYQYRSWDAELYTNNLPFSPWATFKTNSTQIDWPPTSGRINTIAIKNLDSSSQPVLPQTILIGNATGKINGLGTEYRFPLRIRLTEYVGEYVEPARSVTHTLHPAYDFRTINSWQSWFMDGTRKVYNAAEFLWTAPDGPFGNIRQRGGQRYYAHTTTNTSQPRFNGLYWAAPVDIYPNTITYMTEAQSYSVYKFEIIYEQEVWNQSKGAYDIVSRSEDGLPPPSSIVSTGTNRSVQIRHSTGQESWPDIYDTRRLGIKDWESYGGANIVTSTYYSTTSKAYISIVQLYRSYYNLLTGQDSSGNNNWYYRVEPAALNLRTTSTQLTVKSRHHIASLPLNTGVLNKSGTFTATFSGTLANTSELGYFQTDFSLISTGTVTMINQDIWGGAFRKYQSKLQPGGGPPTYYYGTQYNNYNFAAVSTHDQIRPSDFRLTAQSISTTTSTIFTGTVNPSLLTPISQTYTQYTGWLSRRAPTGTVNVINLGNITLTSVPGTADTALPLMLRTSVYPVISETDQFSQRDVRLKTYSYGSLQLLGTSTYTTASTATISQTINYAYQGILPYSTTTVRTETWQVTVNPSLTKTMTVTGSLGTPATEEFLVFQNTMTSTTTNFDLNIEFTASMPQRQGTQTGSWYIKYRIEQWTADGTTLIKSENITYRDDYGPSEMLWYIYGWRAWPDFYESEVRTLRFGHQYGGRRFTYFTVSGTPTTAYLFKVYQQILNTITPLSPSIPSSQGIQVLSVDPLNYKLINIRFVNTSGTIMYSTD